MPNECPFINTSLFLYTPSKSIKIFFDLSASGSVNVFLYQPIPPRNAPPPVPVGLVLSKGISILQSCGRFRLRHAASLNEVTIAAGSSPKKNFQSLLNLIVVLDCALMVDIAAAINIKKIPINFFISSYSFKKLNQGYKA